MKSPIAVGILAVLFVSSCSSTATDQPKTPSTPDGAQLPPYNHQGACDEPSSDYRSFHDWLGTMDAVALVEFSDASFATAPYKFADDDSGAVKSAPPCPGETDAGLVMNLQVRRVLAGTLPETIVLRVGTGGIAGWRYPPDIDARGRLNWTGWPAGGLIPGSQFIVVVARSEFGPEYVSLGQPWLSVDRSGLIGIPEGAFECGRSARRLVEGLSLDAFEEAARTDLAISPGDYVDARRSAETDRDVVTCYRPDYVEPDCLTDDNCAVGSVCQERRCVQSP